MKKFEFRGSLDKTVDCEHEILLSVGWQEGRLFPDMVCEDCGCGIINRNEMSNGKLTMDLIKSACEEIEKGVTPYIAFGQFGVAHSTFWSWMRRSEPIYNTLRCEVDKAAAVARAGREKIVSAGDAKFWLKNSPVSRTQEGRPGWTDETRTQIDVAHTSVQVQAKVDFSRLSLDELLQLEKLHAKAELTANNEGAGEEGADTGYIDV